MKTVTVNLSFQDTLLAEIDAEAQRESRSRSELVREATREYIRRQRRWEEVFRLGEALTKRYRITPADVSREIAAVRRTNRDRA
jgi:CopG family transcriptional regulator/antitoxin EndoAI